VFERVKRPKHSGVAEKLNNYLADYNGIVSFEGTAEMRFASLQEYLCNLIEFECPDAYAKIGDAVCILEHFEFDSAAATKKGSNFKRALSEVNRKFENIVATEAGEVFHTPIVPAGYERGEHSYHTAEHYVANALENMRQHYGRVDSYIDNLRKHGAIDENSKIEIGFFIEGTTLLGNACDPGSFAEIHAIVLTHCKQFLDEFEKCAELDFCICASTVGNKSHLSFINKASIKDYQAKQLDMEEIELIDSRAQALFYKCLIPTEHIDEEMEHHE